MKPCDHYEVPCHDQKYQWCLGPVHWERRSYKKGEREALALSSMERCPWTRDVRAWLDKKGMLKSVNRLKI
jgi:hypothetical protein